jgi:hypothetical protein
VCEGALIFALLPVNPFELEAMKQAQANAELKQRLEKLEQLMNQKNGGAK